jgi:hypothetical protein
MKQIKQFRYYGSMSDRNYPTSLSYGELRVGNIFKNLGVVTHLGIQAAPGTLFYLNNGTHPIRVGSTGIYELDLEGMGQISAIRFEKSTLDLIEDGTNGLLIDIVYEGAGA